MSFVRTAPLFECLANVLLDLEGYILTEGSERKDGGRGTRTVGLEGIIL